MGECANSWARWRDHLIVKHVSSLYLKVICICSQFLLTLFAYCIIMFSLEQYTTKMLFPATQQDLFNNVLVPLLITNSYKSQQLIF